MNLTLAMNFGNLHATFTFFGTKFTSDPMLVIDLFQFHPFTENARSRAKLFDWDVNVSAGQTEGRRVDIPELYEVQLITSHIHTSFYTENPTAP